jgi:hypothetical protein
MQTDMKYCDCCCRDVKATSAVAVCGEEEQWCEACVERELHAEGTVANDKLDRDMMRRRGE